MSFNKPSMNGLNNFDVDEIETLITNNTNNISTNASAITTNASNITTNATNINNKQDEITTTNRLSATLIGANGNVSNTEFGYLSGVTSDIQAQLSFNALATIDNTDDITSVEGDITTIQGNIATNASAISTNTTAISNNASAISTNTTAISNNASAITTNANAITNKQDEITTTNRLSATLIGDNGNVSNTEFGYLRLVTSDIQTQFNDLEDAIDINTEKTTDMTYDSGTSKTTFGNNLHISQTLSTPFYSNVNTTLYSYGQAIALNTAKIGITQEQSDAIEDNTTNISTNLTGINNIGGRLTTIDTNIEGITTSSDTTTIDNQVIISRETVPQLSIIQPTGGNDVSIELRGKRTGSTTSRHAKIDLQNSDTGVTPSVRNMVSIVGRVTNHTSNIGGLEIVNYADGLTATSALTMSANGNFNIGGGTIFQDDYKVNINGKLNVSSSIYQIPQMTSYNFDKNVVSNNFWGNGNRQTDLDSTRTVGTAFSTHNSGTLTFTETGTYKIRVSGNLQSRYNDRLAFAIYLVSLNSSNSVTTDYFENTNYNFFSWLYSRNTSDGAHGNISFEDHIYITSGNKIQIRNKLDTNNTNFDDVLIESLLDLYLNMTITKITDQDINSP